MILIERTIDIPTLSRRITLIGTGCWHVDDPGFRPHLLKECLKEVKSDPHCYLIGLGDYRNFLRTTARKHLQSYVADDNSFQELDTMVKGEAIRFYRDHLHEVRHKILGLAEGNHFHCFQNKTTDTQFLCDLAKVPYLGKPCFMRLNITHKNKPFKTFKVLIHHGDWSGGYTRIGGDANAAEQKAIGMDFDIYFFSHTHRRYAFQSPMLTIPTRGFLRTQERPRVFIRSGTFMAGYDPKCVNSYAHKKLLPPTDLGYVKLGIEFYQEYDKALYQRNRERFEGDAKARSAKTSVKHRFVLEL